MTSKHMLLLACGAGPARDLEQLIALAHDALWTVAVMATPAALSFIDVAAIETATGFAVRDEFRDSSDVAGRTLPAVDALVVAPATYNTINKLASGVADTYALTMAAELIGRRVATVIVPFVNSALASRAPFQRSVAYLREEGVRILLGVDDDWQPHPPGTGTRKQERFPWGPALRAVVGLAQA